eukprot:COSAG03_NODE_366_length_8532_cov_32.998696_2_plen_67_part_00
MDPMAVIAKHSMPEGRPAGHRIAFASGLLARLRVSGLGRLALLGADLHREWTGAPFAKGSRVNRQG